MDASMFAGFALVSLTLACTPGADWAYIISSAISRRSFVPAVLGLLSGYLFHTALVACGIAALVAGSPGLLSWLTVTGALYLLWLGISTLRSWKSAAFYDQNELPQDTLDIPAPAAEHSTQRALAPVATKVALQTPKPKATTGRADFFKGILTSATNPKALLLYVALIPQFISAASQWPLPVQTAVLGLTHFSVSIVVYFAVALCARLLLRSRPTAARIVTLCSGLIMIALSVALAAEQLLTK